MFSPSPIPPPPTNPEKKNGKAGGGQRKGTTSHKLGLGSLPRFPSGENWSGPLALIVIGHRPGEEGGWAIGGLPSPFPPSPEPPRPLGACRGGGGGGVYVSLSRGGDNRCFFLPPNFTGR
eukprot:FR743578.1.p2 GENE.FR743578.1~~FR743578.1.p2  ORF type:complete len:120 (+),score=43.00 FR743578.1:819-1178(+)